MTRFLLAVSVLTLGVASPVYAYIDPVTGSVIVQSIIGAFAVAVVALRGLRDRIINLFRKKPQTEEEQEGTPEP